MITLPEQPRLRGIYLLPNLLTTAGLFAGFFSIVAAMKGHFDTAAIAIFIAMIADTLDGRVARLTNTQTAFGVEFDSLSDMISFGIAPALVAYCWGLSNIGKFGWLASFIYTACGALRLARFNTQVKTADKRYFQGLAIPAAAGVMASLIWFTTDYGIVDKFTEFLVATIAIIVAGLMVSNVRYHSFKGIDLKGKVRFITLVVMTLTFVLIALDPPSVLLIIFFGYALSGPVMTLVRLRQARKDRGKKNPGGHS